MAEKNGIGLVGSVIVDTVLEVLEPGSLVYVDGSRYLSGDDLESEIVEYGTGGMALNNAVNLARMGADYPVHVVGKVGVDENAARARRHLVTNGLSDGGLIVTEDHPTSTTQVIHVTDSGGSVNRCFRYAFGAMGSFGEDDIPYDLLADCRIVMVGYCLLLPMLDREDDEYGARIGRVLEKIRRTGALTCIDFITPKHDRWWKFKRFRKALGHVDILTIGEDQAEGITGIADERKAAEALVRDYGVGTAVIHCGDRGVNWLCSESSGLIGQPIFDVPREEYAGNVGAGDAFASGLLHGFHSGWDEPESLKFATAAAAVSLGSLTTTDAMRDEAYILDYMRTRPEIQTGVGNVS